MPKPKQKTKSKTKPKTQEPEESIDNNAMTFLAVMGILGLILIATGIAAVFLVSLLIGAGLIVTGTIIYIAFYVLEKLLKLI